VLSVAARAAVTALAVALAAPSVAVGHQLTERYQAPLPLVAYIAGAALAVAMSFAFVMLRGGRAERGERGDRADRAERGDRAEARRRDRAAPARSATTATRELPSWLRNGLSAVGLIAWLWIMVQGFFGGNDPTADVGNVFAWVLGWVGVALLSALVGPIWPWLDPFTTLHRLLSAAGRRLGLTGAERREGEWPAGIGRWPAVALFCVVIWLELVGFVLGGRTLATVILGYTLLTLAAMSLFGRETWRRNGEVFSVWFGLLNRLAPFGLAGDPDDGRVERRPFASALGREPWTTADIVLVALGTGSIIYDGLSQTPLYSQLFVLTAWPLPSTLLHTLVMAAFMALLTALVLAVVRALGRQAVGAGLLPVAVGYLLAHYLVALAVDAQALILALNDPLLRGDDLLPYPLNAWVPTLWLPISIVWSIQLAAVVGGHVIGAWAGHAALAPADAARPLRQLPLAALMVLLTSVTLWSLGQEVVAPETAAAAGGVQMATIEPGPDQRAVSSAASTVLMICSLRATSSRNTAQPAETDTVIGAPRSSTSDISRS
jgi:hypothetical protein